MVANRRERGAVDAPRGRIAFRAGLLAFTLSMAAACGKAPPPPERVPTRVHNVLADDPPADGRCAGWRRQLVGRAGTARAEVARCLRELAGRDRTAAVEDARTLLGWGIDARCDDLHELASALAAFPEPGALAADLARRGMLGPPRRDHDPVEGRVALTAFDLLVERGRVHWFDTETGMFPNHHDHLLHELAAIAGAPLDGVRFGETPPPDDGEGEAPYRLEAALGERRWTAEAEDLGDWYDVAAVLGLLNRIAVDLGTPTRFVTACCTCDQTTLVLAADGDAIAGAAADGVLRVEDAERAMLDGQAFERAVRERLGGEAR